MAKAMRYENPIVGVRQVKATKVSKAYTKNIFSQLDPQIYLVLTIYHPFNCM